MTSDALGIEEITSGLTQTVLADDTVPTSPAVAPSANPDEMDEIANRLGQAILEENTDQRLETPPAGPKKEDPEAELDPARAVEKGKGRETEEEVGEIDALGAAWSSCSLEDDEEAKAQREAQQLQEQTQKAQEDEKRALELAEAKKESDEFDALARAFREHGAKAHEIKRKERKEEAARQQRLAAEAEERRMHEERQMQEDALTAQAKRDADDRVRLELARVYERNLAESNAIAIAQANAQEAQRQQQLYEAGLIAQHNEVVARQRQLAELQRWQQQQLFLQQHLAQQHQALPLGELVAERTEGAAHEWVAFEGTEMDTAPEMEASGVTEMDWESVGETTPLLAEPPIPSSHSMQLPTPLVTGPSAPREEFQSSGASFLGEDSESQVLQPEASSSLSAEERPIEADPRPARELMAGTALTAAAIAPAIPEPVAEEPATAAPAAPATVLRLPPRAVTPPLPREATPSLPHEETPLLPRADTTPLPPAPMPAPTPSNPKTIKIVFKRAATNPTLAAFRPTINAWSPLGRLLGQQKSIPKAVLPQVLGKRVREGGEDGGPVKKKAKLDGEFRFEVGGKRKREAEVFSGNKRVMLGRILGRVLAVPGSRFAASHLIASPPILAPTSTTPNAPPSSSPSAPAPPLPSAPSTPSPRLLSTPSPPLPSTPAPPAFAGRPLPVNPNRGLAEAIELFNDLPTLRAEIEWMRAQRRLNTSRRETRGKKSPMNKTIKRKESPASYWSKYRENPSR